MTHPIICLLIALPFAPLPYLAWMYAKGWRLRWEYRRPIIPYGARR